MIKIKNKKDAINKMKELRLNYMPLEFFNVKDIEGIKTFFEKNKAEEYVLRDTKKAKGNYFFVKNFEEVMNVLPKFKDEVTVVVSYRPYKKNLILVGDIKITRGAFGDTVDLTARTDIEATQRNIYEEPQYNLHTSLDDDKIWKIPGFSKLMKYISEHELYDIIVEFLVYDCKVGINKENVVIGEIRTDY